MIINLRANMLVSRSIPLLFEGICSKLRCPSYFRLRYVQYWYESRLTELHNAF